MTASDDQRSTASLPPDLLPLIRRSGVLSDRQLEEIKGKILSGEYPSDSATLAKRLVAESTLTEFQTSRLLRNRASGFVVGQYVLLDRLGEGKKGRVYKAQHKLMGRLVAVKVIAPRIASRTSSIARFHREMRLLGRLDHPNVVRAFDADQVGDLLYFVMEYVAGRDLEQLLQDRGSLAPTEVAAYMAQAALGLGHAHDRGIVHRDVKPTNLMLSAEGEVKVLDLGLGVLMEADRETSFATAAGRCIGTLYYMSPEQATAGEVDSRSDLFSLGCTMYQLLTGQMPFPGETAAECLTRLATGKPVPINELLPNLPAPFIAVLDKLIANQPEDRFQTAVEAAKALQHLAQSGEAGPRPDQRLQQRPAIHASMPDLHASVTLSVKSESHGSPPSATPGPAPCAQPRRAIPVTGWPFVRIAVVPVIVALLGFLIGLAVGYTLGIMRSSDGK
jgi:serine/threonine-protein kinase